MQKSIEIHHHGFETSEALDQNIQERANKLEKFHPGIIGCRISLEQSSHRHRTHDAWTVKLVVTVPPRK